VTFSGAQATINNATGPIGKWNADAITMVDSAGGTKAKPGPLTPDGTSFTVTWFASNAPNGGTGKKSPVNAPMLDGQLPVPVSAPPVVALNVAVAQSAPATPVANPVTTTDAVPRPANNPSTFTAEAISAFFAGQVAVGGMDGIASASGVVDDSSADIPWLTPARGSDLLPPPAVVPPETGTIRQGADDVPTEETGPALYLAMFERTSDLSSTAEQVPIYAADLPFDQSAAAVVLLGVVLNVRCQTSTEKQTKTQRPT
jgi:hypothetical protein